MIGRGYRWGELYSCGEQHGRAGGDGCGDSGGGEWAGV